MHGVLLSVTDPDMVPRIHAQRMNDQHISRSVLIGLFPVSHAAEGLSVSTVRIKDMYGPVPISICKYIFSAGSHIHISRHIKRPCNPLDTTLRLIEGPHPHNAKVWLRREDLTIPAHPGQRSHIHSGVAGLSCFSEIAD